MAFEFRLVNRAIWKRSSCKCAAYVRHWPSFQHECITDHEKYRSVCIPHLSTHSKYRSTEEAWLSWSRCAQNVIIRICAQWYFDPVEIQLHESQATKMKFIRLELFVETSVLCARVWDAWRSRDTIQHAKPVSCLEQRHIPKYFFELDETSDHPIRNVRNSRYGSR